MTLTHLKRTPIITMQMRYKRRHYFINPFVCSTRKNRVTALFILFAPSQDGVRFYFVALHLPLHHCCPTGTAQLTQKPETHHLYSEIPTQSAGTTQTAPSSTLPFSETSLSALFSAFWLRSSVVSVLYALIGRNHRTAVSLIILFLIRGTCLDACISRPKLSEALHCRL